jgi:AcrR family transcriptional regulator
MSGRRAEAARNDTRILESARAVFIANPAAPVAAVAERAKVGISALYRRYPSKEDLLRTLYAHGLRTYLDAAEAAVADTGDVWEAFATFMARVVEADTHALTQRLSGTFTPTEELRRESARSRERTVELVERARLAGVLREDLDVDDLPFLFEQLSGITVNDESRTRSLRARYLALVLQALRADGVRGPLPGPPPTWREVGERRVPR